MQSMQELIHTGCFLRHVKGLSELMEADGLENPKVALDLVWGKDAANIEMDPIRKILLRSDI